MHPSIPDATTLQALLIVLEQHPVGVLLATFFVAVAGYFWRRK